MHLSALIDDLLAYSRLERRQFALGPVDVQSVIERLLDDRCYEIDQRLVEVAGSTLPLREADGTWYVFEAPDPCPGARLVHGGFQDAEGVRSRVRWRPVMQARLPVD